MQEDSLICSQYSNIAEQEKKKTQQNMGKANNGILGAVSGRVGNLIFYISQGEARIRTAGERRAALTPAERINTSKMTALMNFFKYTKPFLRLGFSTGLAHSNLNYHNAATSYNKKHAVQWIDGKAEIVYDQIRLSIGAGLEAQEATVEMLDRSLLFNWAHDENKNWTSGSDQVMLMAYFPEENIAVYELAGAKRKLGQDTLILPASLTHSRMEVYISFISQDRQTVSNSSYLRRYN